jgi:hypothetical protein
LTTNDLARLKENKKRERKKTHFVRLIRTSKDKINPKQQQQQHCNAYSAEAYIYSVDSSK